MESSGSRCPYGKHVIRLVSADTHCWRTRRMQKGVVLVHFHPALKIGKRQKLANPSIQYNFVSVSEGSTKCCNRTRMVFLFDHSRAENVPSGAFDICASEQLQFPSPGHHSSMMRAHPACAPRSGHLRHSIWLARRGWHWGLYL